ncbi:MAG TPA: hypothetical protein VN788_06280 [Verrucomicrobiae bacterium]|nr:hypothetical protein [Verrucomicrobiae bacterium]
MTSSQKKRLLIALLAIIAVIAGAVYLHLARRAASPATAALAPNILTLLPPHAPAIAYIDVTALRRLQNSPLAAILGLTQSGPQPDRDYQDFVRDTGFDYTRDLDKAAIAFWPAISSSGYISENQVVAIADGHFDQPKIKAYALRTGRVVTRNARSIYEVPGNPRVSFEFLSSTRIALASGPTADNLLPPSTSSTPDPAMQARINRVAGAPIFAIARTDNLPPQFYESLRSSPQFQSLAHSVQGLALAGRPDGNLIHLTLEAECNSMKNAIEWVTLLNSLRIFGPIALADPKTRSQMTPSQISLLETLINKTTITHQDRLVRLSLDLTPAMLGAANSKP